MSAATSPCLEVVLMETRRRGTRWGREVQRAGEQAVSPGDVWRATEAAQIKGEIRRKSPPVHDMDCVSI